MAALDGVQIGQIVQRLRDIGVIGAERFLPDRQCPLVERLGIGVAGLFFVDPSVALALNDLAELAKSRQTAEPGASG